MVKPVGGASIRAGIVGSGQLAMMLAEAAEGLGFLPSILAESPASPAARQRHGQGVTLGLSSDEQVLTAFIEGLDFVTFDQELNGATPLTAAFSAVCAAGRSPKLVPSLSALTTCSDKLAQKRHLQAAGLPTPPWLEWTPGGEPARTWIGRVASQFPDGAVLKAARGGYDGRGNLLSREWDGEARLAAEAFCNSAGSRGVPVYAETIVPFVAELAVVSTRWEDGRLVQYPAVHTRQENGVCSEVRGPASAVGISAQSARDAETLAARIGGVFGLTGTYAVEFFLRDNGSLEVNEIAPRVHNSGHFTQEGAATSQFENHWRAVIGSDPGGTETAPFFAMINILGAFDADLPDESSFRFSADGVKAYWYGKSESRAGRKLGHINILASTLNELDRRVAVAWEAVASWRSNLERKVEKR